MHEAVAREQWVKGFPVLNSACYVSLGPPTHPAIREWRNREWLGATVTCNAPPMLQGVAPEDVPWLATAAWMWASMEVMMPVMALSIA